MANGYHCQPHRLCTITITSTCDNDNDSPIASKPTTTGWPLDDDDKLDDDDGLRPMLFLDFNTQHDDYECLPPQPNDESPSPDSPLTAPAVKQGQVTTIG
jgi:hypothetical protein